MKCVHCDKTFSSSSTLNRHLKNVHKYETGSVGDREKFNNVCLEGCEKSFRFTVDLIKHLRSVHEIVVNASDLQYGSLSDFDKWLEDKARNERAAYFRYTGTKSEDFGEGITKKLYYHCSRSGHFTSKTMGKHSSKRTPRLKGTKKLNFNCTSHIIVNVMPDGSVTGTFYKEHYGHARELASFAGMGIIRRHNSSVEMDTSPISKGVDYKEWTVECQNGNNYDRRRKDDDSQVVSNYDEAVALDMFKNINSLNEKTSTAEEIKRNIRKNLMVIQCNIEKMNGSVLADMAKRVKTLAALSDGVCTTSSEIAASTFVEETAGPSNRVL